MLLTEALRRFEATCGASIAPSTLHTYRSALRSLQAFGITTTKDLARARVAAWLAKRAAEDLAPSTINTQLAAVLSIVSFLERSALFPLERLMNLRRLRMKMQAAPPPVFLTRDELARLLVAAAAVHPCLVTAVLLAVFAGLRLSELRALERDHFFLEGPLPYVYVARDGHGRRTARTVPIARTFAQRLRLELPVAGPIFPPMHPNCRGAYVAKGTLQEWLRRARDQAGLYHVTWFVLRHSFASYLRQGGVELSKISGWMGNTVRICEKHYAALAPGGDGQVEKMLPAGEAPAA
jgi:integrase